MRAKFFVDTFTFRCWPEVIADELYGITACSTLGHLTAHGITTACEGDVYGAFLIGCPATAVLGYVGQHFSYQHGIALFGGTFALGALALLVARICFFKRDRVETN